MITNSPPTGFVPEVGVLRFGECEHRSKFRAWQREGTQQRNHGHHRADLHHPRPHAGVDHPIA